MEPSDIISIAKKQTGSVGVISDTEAYSYLNQFHKELAYAIMNIDNNYNKTFWRSSLVSWQNEYTLQEVTPLASEIKDRYWQLKIETVYIKYKTDDDYTKIEQKDFDNLDKPTDYYQEEQSKDDPFYIIADNSIYIYPTPDENVGQGLKLWWSRKLYDLDNTSTAEEILVPEEFQETLQLGVQYKMYWQRWIDYRNQYMSVKEEYEREKRLMLNEIKTRITEPIIADRMDLSHLE